MGGVFRTYEDGMIECVGHKPDIDCTGRDALQVAFEQIEEKNKSLSQTSPAKGYSQQAEPVNSLRLKKENAK